MNKKLLSSTLLIILIGGFAIASITHFCTVQASTDASDIPKPSVPEFTVEVVSGTVEITIKNQPFTSYYDDSLGQHVFLDYNIRLKRHFEGGWTELYRASDGYLHQWSDSDCTVRTLRTETGIGITIAIRDGFSITFPAGDQVDFQVEAMIGYVHRDVSQAGAPWVFTGETSGWSETQTITIGESQTPTSSPTTTPSPTVTPTPTPTESPQQTEFTVIIGATIVVAVLGAGLGLLIYLIKRK